jgi:hypothetical protein
MHNMAHLWVKMGRHAGTHMRARACVGQIGDDMFTYVAHAGRGVYRVYHLPHLNQHVSGLTTSHKLANTKFHEDVFCSS